MNRSSYLDCPDVRDFVEWSTRLATGEWGLVHDWSSDYHKNPRTWSCTSLYDAHKRYCWDSKDFGQTSEILDGFRRELCDATAAGKDEFVKVALKICRWGGNNVRSLKKLSDQDFQQIEDNANLLDPRYGDADNLKGFKFMGSGYSKVYSHMIKDFPMYDSRVACALTSLIWLFSRDKSRPSVPCLLRLGVPPGRNEDKVNHNPSRGPYQFPNIRGQQHTLYADSNLRAAWLLGALADHGGQFNTVPRERRVRALESALFMLGYEPLKKIAIRKT